MSNVIFHHSPVFNLNSRAVSDTPLASNQEKINTEGNKSDLDVAGSPRRNLAMGQALIENAADKISATINSVLLRKDLVEKEFALFEEKSRKFSAYYRDRSNAAPISDANRQPEPSVPILARLPEGPDVENILLLHDAQADIDSAKALGTLSAQNADFWDNEVQNVRAYEAYYKLYENGVTVFNSLIMEFKAFLGTKTQYLEINKDNNGNDIMSFDKAILAKLQEIIDKFSGNAGIMFPASGTASEADAKAWAKEWDIDPALVKNVNGGWVVRMDLTPLVTIYNDLEKSGVDKTMNGFQYQSWEAGFNAQSDILDNTLRILMTNLTNKFGETDVLVKGASERLAERKRQIQSLQSDR